MSRSAFGLLKNELFSVSTRRSCCNVRFASSAAGPSSYTLPKVSAEKFDGSVKSETNRAEKTNSRFWKTVGIKEAEGGHQITLDSRALRTPSGKPLLIPEEKKVLAFLIANEWENQEKILKNHSLPLTSIASRALDSLTGSKELHQKVREALIKYLDTDTICFHESQPERLVRLQKAHWDPLLAWAREEYSVPKLKTFESVLVYKQDPDVRKVFEELMESWDGWKLAAFERAVYTTKSFLIALALVEGRISVEEAAKASQVEVDSQIELWGEVEDTHDVDFHDVRRQLGSVACVLMNHK